ncbi:histone-lysine N-methyltransferase, H3 lysine-9 specific SUVH1 isoform X1 [Brachypodium distachyon]|uniref:histone-lysine N-methyltransferase, H3 lysine-9 specific SUVH1 isoform X1 n=1 Tax=Brachypodium distachyon TaxID=15368 RepID=UPI00071E26A3|nr:histone-lysine N-methyltransferase, H3 lysine-9 specific SUVH1 isoform X1 [Brachypodium distachyon]XP_014753693.1 histone-lysine N-methyltransferase, H3 lysine-9 specific SUVH1 isoform X1 [Brachypodium distachyon]XP_024316013.1 histone-lysine N-methyltransferase, H3 lysine-9 specific SUVH1 isoform X1 [Brachypodium distachyon]|eukprot:XP_014753692.1 histone-lysine N-methyltransferase, H3 lysine-9 specific SUVH1 isoform X1 [Brachypodium distachyon]
MCLGIVFTMEKSNVEAENEEEQPLEPKPLLSLAPMFPTPSGYDVATQSADPPVVHVTPFTPTGSSSTRPAAASFDRPFTLSPVSVALRTPRHEVELSAEYLKPFLKQKKTTSAKRVRPTKESSEDNINRRSIKKSLNENLVSIAWPSSLDNPRESVEELLIMFDSLRRRTVQLDEKEDTSRRADMKTGTLMMSNNLRINHVKTIGHVPGVKIGDIFFFRIEMCIVGLHAPAMGGIDYMPIKDVGKDQTLAVCILSAGGYENDEQDTDILVYTGQGGNSRKKEKHDQKLERGNLALMNSKNKKSQIRVVRSTRDPFHHSDRIYIYDGLYSIEDSWIEKGKNGFKVFKYKLRREIGQPDGISVWKMAQKWKANPAARENVIQMDLSSKVENLPVCLVNEVSDVKRPIHFNYATGVKYLIPLNRETPVQNCKCRSLCLPGDINCSCARQNGGDLPYSSSGLLVRHIPMLYECSSNCQCSQHCRNRVTQKGIRLSFEVFWTGDRGWGLRSWDPIHAGAFICEYTGEVTDKMKMNTDDKEDDYIFHTACLNDKVLRWNLGAELLEETSRDIATESPKQLPMVISAKDSGNVARFLNHSCSPNLLWQAVQYDHGDDSYPHIMFFAMKHIPPMTELTYDYGIRGAPPGFKNKFPKACKLKACLCGSINCRGFL